MVQPASLEQINKSLPALSAPITASVQPKDWKEETQFIQLVAKKAYGPYAKLLTLQIAKQIKAQPCWGLLGEDWLDVREEALSKESRSRMLEKTMIVEAHADGITLRCEDEDKEHYDFKASLDYGISTIGSGDIPVVVFVK